MNRLQKLQQDLQATTKAKEVTNVHLANITGFSRPSISEAIRSGKINNRMNRVLDLVDLVTEAYHITSLWELAEPNQGATQINMHDWVSKKVDKHLSACRVLEENQLDMVDVYGRPETPDWLPLQLQDEAAKLSDAQLHEVVRIGEISQQGAIGAFKELIKNSSEIDAQEEGKPKAYYGFTSPLALNMIESDIKHGHINEDYSALIDQLKAMFGEKGHYEFKEVRAALVALECPEMIEKVQVNCSVNDEGNVIADSPAVTYKQLATLQALECYTQNRYSYRFYKSWYHKDVKGFKRVQNRLDDGVNSAVFVESGKKVEVLYQVPTEPGRSCAEWVQEWLLKVIEENGDLPDFLEWLKGNSEVRLVVLPGTKNRALLGISTEQNLIA